MTKYRGWVSITKYRVFEFDMGLGADDEQSAWDYATDYVWNKDVSDVEGWQESGPDEVELTDIAERE